MTDTQSYWSSAGTSRRAFIGGSVAASLLGLAACTKAAGSGGGGASASSLTVGIGSDVSPANLLQQNQANFPVRALVFDYLVGLDQATGSPIPSVAKSWSWNTAKTELTMQLRDNVVYHTGRPFTAADVAYSVNVTQQKSNASQLRPVAVDVTATQVVGPHEVTFKLAKPSSAIFDLLALMPLIDSKTFSGLTNGSKVIGTGPFTWQSWTPGTSLVLKRNDKYWQAGRPYLDSVTLQVYAKSQALVAAMQSGQIPAAFALVPSDVATLQKSGHFSIKTSAPEFTEWYIGLNTKSAPLTDPRARLAVAYALDRERIASQVFAGYATASAIPFSDTAPGLSTKDNALFTYDPARAKELFKQAGSPKEPVGLAAKGNYPIEMDILNIVQYNLESVGFNVRPQALDNSTLQAQLQSASIDGMWIGATDLTSVSVPVAVLGNAPLRATKNTSNIDDPKYTKIISALSAAADQAALASATRELVDYMGTEAFHLTVAHGLYLTVSQGVSGIAMDASKNLLLTDAKTG